MNQSFASKLVCALALVVLLLGTMEVLAGGKGGEGEDIILYKNNIVIRGEGGKGKGKGGGGGNFVLATGPEKEHHHDHGEWDHHGYGEMGHHGHKEHSISPLLFMGGNNNGKGNKGKGGRGNRGKKNNNDDDDQGMDMIEQLLMAQMG